jgi:uncharacterized cupin superfamily protein
MEKGFCEFVEGQSMVMSDEEEQVDGDEGLFLFVLLV